MKPDEGQLGEGQTVNTVLSKKTPEQFQGQLQEIMDSKANIQAAAPLLIEALCNYAEENPRLVISELKKLLRPVLFQGIKMDFENPEIIARSKFFENLEWTLIDAMRANKRKTSEQTGPEPKDTIAKESAAIAHSVAQVNTSPEIQL